LGHADVPGSSLFQEDEKKKTLKAKDEDCQLPCIVAIAYAIVNFDPINSSLSIEASKLFSILIVELICNNQNQE